MTSKKLIAQYRKLKRARLRYIDSLYKHTFDHRHKDEDLGRTVRELERTVWDHHDELRKKYAGMIGTAITREIDREPI